MTSGLHPLAVHLYRWLGRKDSQRVHPTYGGQRVCERLAKCWDMVGQDPTREDSQPPGNSGQLALSGEAW